MIERALCPLLVGREDELAALEDVVVGATRSAGGSAVVVGDAGMGKTRLANELARRAASWGMAVLRGSCPESDLTLSYLPVVEALGNHLRRADRDALRARLGHHAPTLARLLPGLAGGSRPEDDVPPALDLFEALLALVELMGGEGGALLVLDDLHWADVATRSFVEFLVRRLPDTPVALLVTTREQELAADHPVAAMLRGWRRARAATTVTLDPLDEDEVTAMVGAILDSDDVAPEVGRHLRERSLGNPYVVEELMRTALDTGEVVRRGGHWEQLTRAGRRLPHSVTDAIHARVDGLGADGRSVVEALAVLGDGTPVAELAAATGRAPAAVAAAIESAVRRQLVDAPGGSVAAMRHALTRHAVLDALPPDRVADLHGRAADHLLATPGSAPVAIARHLLGAGRRGEAMPHCLAASAAAVQRAAVDEAIALARLAVDCATTDSERGTTLCHLGEVLSLGGDPPAGAEALTRGVALLQETGRPLEAAQQRLALAHCLWELGRDDESYAQAARVRDELEPLGPSPALADAWRRLALQHVVQLESREARSAAERALAIAATVDAGTIAIGARMYRAVALGQLGRVAVALAEVDRARRLATEAGAWRLELTMTVNAMAVRHALARFDDIADGLDELAALHGGAVRDLLHGTFAAVVALARCDVEGAVTEVRAAAALARRHGYGTYEPELSTVHAHALVEAGMLDEAATVLPRAVRKRETQSAVEYVRLALQRARNDLQAAMQTARGVLGTTGWAMMPATVEGAVLALVDAGCLDDAESALADRGDLFGQPGMRLFADPLYGALAAARGDHDSAVELLTAGVEAREQAGDHLAAARLRLRLARVLGASGDGNAAVAVLNPIADRLGEGAVLLAGEVAAARRDLGLPAQAAVNPRPGGRPRPQPAAAERLVTVLFADVRGWTGLTAAGAPHDLAERVATFHRWARREVERRGGLVDKYAGDAVMAVFNAERSDLEHPVRAVEAAAALLERTALVGLPVGAGVATGPAVVGSLVGGANLSVLGEATNLASRLQAAAAAGEVLLSGETHRRTRDATVLRGRLTEPVELVLKGFPAPVSAVRVRVTAPGAPAATASPLPGD